MAEQNKVILQTGLDLTGFEQDSQRIVTRMSSIYAEVSKVGKGAKQAFMDSLSEADKLLLRQQRISDLLKNADSNTPRYDKLKTAYRDVTAEIAKMQTKVADTPKVADTSVTKTKGIFSSLTGHISTELKQIGLALAGAFAVNKIKGFAEESFNEFVNSEKAAALLRTQIVNIGNEGESAFSRLENQAKKLQATGIFEDDDIVRTQTLFAQFGLGSDTIEQLIPIITDFAAATGLRLQDAANTVIQGTEGMGRGLKKYGVTVDDAKSKQEKFVSITEQLRQKFQGAEIEIAKTSAGALARFGNSMSDLKENIGQALAVALTPFIEKLTAFIQKMQGVDFTPVTNAVKVITATLSFLWKQILVPLGESISTLFTPIINSLARALGDAGDKASRFQQFLLLITAPIKIVVEGVKALVSGLTDVLDLIGIIDKEADKRQQALNDTADKRRKYYEDLQETAKQGAAGYNKAVTAILADNAKLQAGIDELQNNLNDVRSGVVEAITVEDPVTGKLLSVYKALNGEIVNEEVVKMIQERLKGLKAMNEQVLTDITNNFTAGGESVKQFGQELSETSKTAALTAGSLAYYQDIVNKLTERLKNVNLTSEERFNISKELSVAQNNLNNATEEYNRLIGVTAQLEKNSTDVLQQHIDEIDRSFNNMKTALAKQYEEGAISYESYQIALVNIEYLNTQQRLQIQIDYYKAIAQMQLLLGQDITDSLNKIASLEASLGANTVDMLRKSRAAAAEIYRQQAKDAAQAAGDTSEAWKENLKKVADTIDTVAQANIAAANSILAYYQSTNDEIIKIQEHRVDEASKIAERGNAELLQLEQHRLDESYKQQAKYVRDQQALNLILSGSNMVVAISKAVAEGGGIGSVFTVLAAIASFVGGMLAARQALQSAQSGFKKGGYTGEGGEDEVAGVTHKREFVFDAVTTRKNRKIFEEIHRDKLDLNELISRKRKADSDRYASEVLNKILKQESALDIRLNHGRINKAIEARQAIDLSELKSVNNNIQRLERAIKEQERLAVHIDEGGIYMITNRFKANADLNKKLRQ